jgi:shikimate dehydrogenase
MPSPITLCGSLSLHAVSLGASMHLAGYRALDLSFTYVPFAVPDAAHLADALRGMRGLGIRGFGVSYPYKQAVMAHLDAIDPMAKRIGAVNTIVNDDGKLTGHNTDWIGAVRAIEEHAPLAGANVLLLGAGGAASAIAHGLAESKAHVTIASRDRAKGEALARAVGGKAMGLDEVKETNEFDLLVNATPVGMAGVDDSMPVPGDALHAELVVMDIVYKPIETRVLAAARACDATAIHGGRMLLYQAARQFELYTARTAPLAAMDAALREAIGVGGSFMQR